MKKNFDQNWPKVGNYFQGIDFLGKGVLSEKALKSYEKNLKCKKQIHEIIDKRLLYNTKTVLFVILNLFRLFLSFKND